MVEHDFFSIVLIVSASAKLNIRRLVLQVQMVSEMTCFFFFLAYS